MDDLYEFELNPEFNHAEIPAKTENIRFFLERVQLKLWGSLLQFITVYHLGIRKNSANFPPKQVLDNLQQEDTWAVSCDVFRYLVSLSMLTEHLDQNLEDFPFAEKEFAKELEFFCFSLTREMRQNFRNDVQQFLLLNLRGLSRKHGTLLLNFNEKKHLVYNAYDPNNIACDNLLPWTLAALPSKSKSKVMVCRKPLEFFKLREIEFPSIFKIESRFLLSYPFLERFGSGLSGRNISSSSLDET